jgi:hypothetical protein
MRRKHARRIVLWSVILLCILVLLFVLPQRLEKIVNYGDSLIFWAPSQLIIQGDNPYDEDLLVGKLNEAGRSPNKADPLSFPMMVYPPWVFLVLIPLGGLDYPAFRMLWLMFHLLLIFLSADMVWRIYFKVLEKRWLSWLTALTFAPTIRAASVGNITPVVLFGMICFLFFISLQPYQRRNDLFAGASILLVTIKPQLLYLFLVILLLWIFIYKRWSVLIGAGVSILVGLGFAAIFNHQVFINYLHAMQTFPFYAYQTPTIGAILRTVFSNGSFWLQFTPVCIGLAWGLMYFSKHKKNWDWMQHAPIVIIVSLLTAPFAWTYDLIFLIMPLIIVIGQLFSQSISAIPKAVIMGSYTILNILVFIFYAQTHDFWLFWLTPAFAIWYVCSQVWIQHTSLDPRHLALKGDI